MRSVPPRGSGWVLEGNCALMDRYHNGRTHPLPRGGTDLMRPDRGTKGKHSNCPRCFHSSENFTIEIMYMLKVRSSAREELVEFTEQVQEKLKESGEPEGVVVLYVQHTTAGLTVNENADPDVQRDMLHAFRTLIPQHGMGFRHGEENSDAHIKATLVGSSVTIPFKDGKLLLGRWQGIFLCEFDGGRERKVIMMVH
jgi:secondary thiamine-phosphate synthase enzyme